MVGSDNPGMIRTLVSSMMQRLHFARVAFQGTEDVRDYYKEFGWPRTITEEMMRARYQRGGIAGRIVDAFPKATWKGVGWLIEDDDPDVITEFEARYDEMEARLNLWRLFRRADILAQLGPFSAILLGLPGTDLSKAPPRSNTSEALAYATPFWKPQVKIKTYSRERNSPRFALPETYEFQVADPADPTKSMWIEVHYTRVVHIAENTLESELFGEPRLHRCWNDLVSLIKVTGGAPEMFWKAAYQGQQWDIDPELKVVTNPDGTSPTLEKLREQADEYQEGLRRIITTRGVDVKQLSPKIADPRPTAEMLMDQICGSTEIPKRILLGSERGELASSQDRDNWNDRVNERRDNFAGPVIIRQFAQRLIEAGVLPEVEYKTYWPEMGSLSRTEKADIVVKIAKAQKDAGKVYLTPDEIRVDYLDKSPMAEVDEDIAAKNDELDEPEPAPGSVITENDPATIDDNERRQRRAAALQRAS